VGTPFSNLSDPQSLIELPQNFEKLDEQGFITYEAYHVRKEGSFFPVLVNISVIKSPEGQKLLYVGNVLDTTRLKITAEEKILQLVNDLEKSNRELEEFAFSASHDLKDPIRTIITYISLMVSKNKNQFDAETHQYSEFIIEAAQRMSALIDSLLLYSRAGKKTKNIKVVDCNAVLEIAKADLKTGIQLEGAKISSENLPEIMGDEIQIRQLFQNLIGNAIKYSKNTVQTEIVVSAKKIEKAWLFSVKDNGIGIEKAYLEKIFLMFQRLHARSEYSGTGIGLALCKKIVEAHGGKIWVESTLGEGSTFFFTIPS
jgi:light-regulated signal transduction histidine kinase (bacteriophytochrome)